MNPGVDRAGDVKGAARSPRTRAEADGGGQARSGLGEPPPLQQQRGVKAAPAWGHEGQELPRGAASGFDPEKGKG